MASSSISNAHHRRHVFFPVLDCKCPSSLHFFKFQHYQSVSYPLSSTRPQKHATRISAKISTSTAEIQASNGGASTSLKSRKKVGKKSPAEGEKNGVMSAAVADEEDMSKRITSDKYFKKMMHFRTKEDKGSDGSVSVRSKDRNLGNRGRKTKVRFSETGKRDDGDKVGVGRRGPEKTEAELREIEFRVALDSCSKRGDVMGGLELYGQATKEGLKLNQYHYSVLLYLCSSAASGVVRPAKSGNAGRSLGLNVAAGSSENEAASGVDETNKKGGSSMASGTIQEENFIVVSDEVKKHAIEKGYEIYQRMCKENVEMNEASFTAMARIAMSMGNGDLAFEVVKQMKRLEIIPKLRSYGPALSAFCTSGDIEKAFEVEGHMLEQGINPEEPELEALLRLSIEAANSGKVYYLLHKFRTIVRKVSAPTADLIRKWFESDVAAKVGKSKWNKIRIKAANENGGGGWHGQGWLGKGKWTVSLTTVRGDGFCSCCNEKLALIDLDPIETEKFAESVASIAMKREKQLNFQKFQQWLDYYGPFEAVVDAANVGLYSQHRFMPTKIGAVVNGIRQMLPSKKWPLIILHNRRVTGNKMDEEVNKALVDKWKNADALYPTPTGSNDDWYWLYAAIKFKCLLVTNDEMRDHTFHLLGNDFFPRWKERHQVHFSFNETGPVFHMPPSCSVVIQESVHGYWHVPIESEVNSEEERKWLCITRTNSSSMDRQGSATNIHETEVLCTKKSLCRTIAQSKQQPPVGSKRGPPEETIRKLKSIVSGVELTKTRTVLSDILKGEELGKCTIDFQI